MKTTPAPPATAHPPSLDMTMRLGGVLVSLLSAFLLVRDVSFGIGDDIFCALSLSLGLATFIISWLPTPEDQSVAPVTYP